MSTEPFPAAVESEAQALAGSWRAPRQMLASQQYDNHASLHDDAMAQKLGFRSGPIEGPTHFSQFAPLGWALWGQRFFEAGRISAHYRNMVVEGEEVRAFAKAAGADHAEIGMQKRDGTEVLRGTLSVGEAAPPSALDLRLAALPPLSDPVILADVRVGLRMPAQRVRMDPDQHMGPLYPFSLNQKLAKITEPSSWYRDADTPWGRPIIPLEMISVLVQYTSRQDRLPVRGPAVGLFADQEIRLIDGPLFVGEDYLVEREVVALAGSRRTESVWVRSEVRSPADGRLVATTLLNSATLKDSYAPYEAERAALYPPA
jgi:hypothetical protein